MKPLPSLLAAATLLASAGLAPAEPARSLNDARSQINSGTWPGITLIETKPKAAPAEPPAGAASAGAAALTTVPAPAAAATAGTGAKAADTATPSPASRAAAPVAAPPAPAAPAAATSATAPAAAANSTSFAERLRALVGPPSGVPMNQATRLDSPDLGIVLPTGTASAASGAAK
ncbi:MAG: hypothetical protein U5L05_04510 [Rubrivivax sp.]|nr:hypothetical protein [Rubrivivax sp.]